MDIDLDFFERILSIDSTSTREEDLRDFLLEWISFLSPSFSGVDKAGNLMALWGVPKVVYNTHLDTVPPYIPPYFDHILGFVSGRGTCDAKGQILAILMAVKRLLEDGSRGFGVLFTVGEECGSIGAKAFDPKWLRSAVASFAPEEEAFDPPALVVCEPTNCRFLSASKGTKAFTLTLRGLSAHSGYPDEGLSAVEGFVHFYESLRAVDFPDDPILGPTTFNIGKLASDNPQNILSPELSFRLYFRTTFASDDLVSSFDFGSLYAGGCEILVEAHGGDAPARYHVPEGFPGAPASFGSDAPHLNGFGSKSIYGPGSILDAHTDHEKVDLYDIHEAAKALKEFFRQKILSSQ